MNPPTRIEVPDDLPLVRIIREFDASPDRVFQAHVDPELFVQWVGPHALSSVADRWDARSGGEWRYAMREPDGGEHWFRGCFHEVRAPERLVQTFCYEPFADAVALETLVFEALEGGRCRLVSTSLAGSFEDRDSFVASGMEQGVTEGYDKLDRLLG
jgi:uncharacterized protein YndB with AHSA1/START domain